MYYRLKFECEAQYVKTEWMVTNTSESDIFLPKNDFDNVLLCDNSLTST